eukprot:TRINITY_DN48114_c0_g1_i1.p1 TRINITY_DN48114_c0_g1~~TRINITY_DN48114_c0_g1_i1.p1  ORF type:complete len:324 (-),score=64.13 TRINITY_DN48114_c0_g1_i1:375-1289(-)
MAEQTDAAASAVQCKVGTRCFEIPRTVIAGRHFGNRFLQAGSNVDLSSILPQECHSHFDTALDFMYGRPIALNVNNAFMLHQIAAVLNIDDLRKLSFDSMLQQGQASDAAAAQFVEQVLHSELPTGTKRLLLRSLPAHVVQQTLAELAGQLDETSQVVDFPRTVGGRPSNALRVAATPEDAEARRILSQALDGDVAADALRALVKSLPLHVVQSELGRRANGTDTAVEVQQQEAVTVASCTDDLDSAVAEENDVDVHARRTLSHALDSRLCAAELRSLVKSLPLHVVQSELGKRFRDASLRSKL